MFTIEVKVFLRCYRSGFVSLNEERGSKLSQCELARTLSKGKKVREEVKGPSYYRHPIFFCSFIIRCPSLPRFRKQTQTSRTESSAYREESYVYLETNT